MDVPGCTAADCYSSQFGGRRGGWLPIPQINTPDRPLYFQIANTIVYAVIVLHVLHVIRLRRRLASADALCVQVEVRIFTPIRGLLHRLIDVPRFARYHSLLRARGWITAKALHIIYQIHP